MNHAPSLPQAGQKLPQHDDYPFVTRALELLSLAVAIALLVCQIMRLACTTNLGDWWLLPAALAGIFTADLISGLVHWFADTWFDESVPFLGPRFLRPFRVHHINPGDFLRRDLVDTNGDVAMLTIPFLLTVFVLPLTTGWGQAAAAFLVALSAAGLPTNQVHQWAHMQHPPRWVVCLQRVGLILNSSAHQRHHCPPHVTNYCIATGWCNPILSAVDFFPRLERWIIRLTGLQPRRDDAAFRDLYPAPTEDPA